MSPRRLAELRGPAMVEVCIRVYLDHHDDGSGSCAPCRGPLSLCSARRNSGKVMRAVGLDPVKFDRPTLFAETDYVRPAFDWGGR